MKKIFNRLNRRDLPLFPNVKKFSKPFLIILALFFVTFATKNIIAQTQTTDTAEETEEIITTELSSETIQGFKDKQNAMEAGNNQESWMKEALGSNAMAGINILAGTIPDSVLDGEGLEDDQEITWNPGGLIGLTNKGISTLYNIPISGTEYLAQVKANFLRKPAYAETGFQAMSPLIPLWKGFRNATYLVFSIIFILIGLMIMFRIKIDPQTTLTIQSTIPKIITALILVTFSYAIVGLLIDLSYVITGLGLSIILKASGDSTSVIDIIAKPQILVRAIGIAPVLLVVGAIGGIITLILTALSGIAGTALGVISIVVIFFIGVIFIFINVLKFFIGLIKCYITVLLKTIIAPLEIALGAIPNMQMGFKTWFISIIANLMVFPVTLIFLVLVRKIMDAVKTADYLWTPPGLGILSGGNTIAIIIGLGSLMLLAKLPKLIPEFIFQIKPSPFGTAIGESFNSTPGLKPIKSAASEKFGRYVVGRGNEPSLFNRLKTKANTSKGAQTEANKSKGKPLGKDTF